MFWLSLTGFAAACAAAASTGAMFPPGPWYERLDKPSWTPPNWMFPVVWTVLYALMAYTAARIAVSGDALAPAALSFWAAQIALNAIWTPIFFGQRRMRAALVVIGLMWLAVAATIVSFFLIDRVAGALLAPYLLWVSTAAALNASLLRRNPDLKPALST